MRGLPCSHGVLSNSDVFLAHPGFKFKTHVRRVGRMSPHDTSSLLTSWLDQVGRCLLHRESLIRKGEGRGALPHMVLAHGLSGGLCADRPPGIFSDSHTHSGHDELSPLRTADADRAWHPICVSAGLVHSRACKWLAVDGGLARCPVSELLGPAWDLYPAPGPHFNYGRLWVSLLNWHHNSLGFLLATDKNSKTSFRGEI